MAKVIITGGLGFLGFEMCLSLLEEGYEVLAVDQQNETGERWLEVGRNANITYQPFNRTIPDDVVSASIYINLYDYLSKRNKEEHNIYNAIKKIIKELKGKIEEAVILIPTVLSERSDEGELNDFLDFLNDYQFKKGSKFYIPTLIGPHQPDTFLFQQLLTKTKCQTETTKYVDDTRSAIFVKDAADTIIKSKREPKDYLLVSKTPNSWNESLNLLEKGHTGARAANAVKNICPADLQHLVVEASSTFEEVLELQRNV